MNTPSHIILNLALLGRRAKSHLNGAILWGALVPDLAMFGFYGWAKLIARMDEATIWNQAFFEPFWQDIFAVGNSIPLALVGMGIAFWVQRRYPQWRGVATAVIFLALSAILHSLADLPLHADDGHRHFWPLSDFRYASPVSYWDPEYHGRIFALVEGTLVLVASRWVWRLLRSRWAKFFLVASNALMVFAYTQFYL